MFTLTISADLQLALVEPAFAKHYLEIVNNEREYLSEWLAWPPHADSEAFFLNFIKGSLHKYADGTAMVCAMIYQGQVVGNIGFNTISHELKKVEMGYWLSREYQGNGIVTQSVFALMTYAFEQLKMDKVEIAAAKENRKSRGVCERLGMTLEGIITNNENINGRIVDHAVYGLMCEQFTVVEA